MALVENAIAITIDIKVRNENLKLDLPWGKESFDQANPGQGGTTQPIGTGAETVVVTDLTTEGWCFMRNLDDTNFIEIGPDSGGQVDFMKLLAGEFAVFPLAPGTVIKATADTAECLLQTIVLER